MCGRFTLTSPDDQLRDLFQVFDIPNREATYNIAPFQNIVVILEPEDNEKRIAKLATWGFEHHWSKTKPPSRLINARAETVLEKTAFASPFREYRCLIPSTGFFEWKKVGKLKQPYLFKRKNDAPFAFAGLYRVNENDPKHYSCVILTVEANDVVRKLHDRMPVILEERDYERWLKPTHEPEKLLELCSPFSSDEMMSIPVNPCVNTVGMDIPKCLERSEIQGSLF